MIIILLLLLVYQNQQDIQAAYLKKVSYQLLFVVQLIYKEHMELMGVQINQQMGLTTLNLLLVAAPLSLVVKTQVVMVFNII